MITINIPTELRTAQILRDENSFKFVARLSGEAHPKGHYLAGHLKMDGSYEVVPTRNGLVTPDTTWLQDVCDALKTSTSLKDVGSAGPMRWTRDDIPSLDSSLYPEECIVYAWWATEIDDISRMSLPPAALTPIIEAVRTGKGLVPFNPSGVYFGDLVTRASYYKEAQEVHYAISVREDDVQDNLIAWWHEDLDHAQRNEADAATMKLLADHLRNQQVYIGDLFQDLNENAGVDGGWPELPYEKLLKRFSG